MLRHCNNKGRIILPSMLLALCLMLCLMWALYRDSVSSGPYLNSAHGNTTYGVDRIRTGTGGFGYSKGNCAHCHEQHASIGGQTITPQGYALFYDNVIGICDGVCFRCHMSVAPEQEVINYLYSISFGGYLPLALPGIYNHFCNALCTYVPGVQCGSRHSLAAIYNFIKNNGQNWG